MVSNCLLYQEGVRLGFDRGMDGGRRGRRKGKKSQGEIRASKKENRSFTRLNMQVY